MSQAAIAAALSTAGLSPPTGRRSSGPVQRIDLADGGRVMAKTGDAAVLEAEAAGLRALAATGTIRVATVHTVGQFGGIGVLLLEYIERGSAVDAVWRRFGAQLAALHQTPAGDQYGFDHDNHLGATPQVNTWSDDWVGFNRACRLGPQLRRAASAQRLRADEISIVQRIIDRLDELIPARPHAGLLHGDLWSGNAMVSATGEIVVIDPACSIGDGWADIAMMRLFGGFPQSCFDAYHAATGVPDDLPRRIAVYQLYHLLNHVNLFGRSYATQTVALARSI